MSAAPDIRDVTVVKQMMADISRVILENKNSGKLVTSCLITLARY